MDVEPTPTDTRVTVNTVEGFKKVGQKTKLSFEYNFENLHLLERTSQRLPPARS